MKQVIKWVDFALNLAMAAVSLYTIIFILKKWNTESSEAEEAV